MRGLDGKVAVVTGAAGRIGKAVVLRLIEEGVRVVVADVNAAGAEATAAAYGDKAIACTFDAADEASIERLIATTIDRFGRIDILHNNAAYVALGELGTDVDAITTPLDLWDATMNVNVRGYLLACRHVLPHMVAAGSGSIINMSSGSGLAGDYVRIAYGTSKGAIATMTQYVATQHGKQGIRCNAIAPGMMADAALREAAPQLYAINERHSLTPRGGRPEDIASLVAFLGSDESTFITGQIISCDGGLLAHQPQMLDSMALDSAYS
ncbi:MAG: short chain dehydrogenase family protein [Rhizorhabdus sp.]|nr:short chain dehydrogenase family protein [Rhizorhabdus sp.]